MDQIKKPNSFFDDSNIEGINKIWLIPPQNKKEQKEINPTLATEFVKICKKQGKFKPRYLMLEENYLYMSKSKKKQKISGGIELIICRCDWLILENPKQYFKDLKYEKMWGFRLTKNQQFIEVYHSEENAVLAWHKALQYKVIQTTFHDEFLLQKIIGKGSFAKVYLGKKIVDEKLFAIKAFNKQNMKQQKSAQAALINEIQIMRQLDCKQLLKLYETYETENTVYLIVDLLNGGQLLNDNRREGQFQRSQIQEIMKNILLGLDYMHQRQIMHRDLKPENILIRNSHQEFDLVIADFGLAAFCDQNEILFKVCGSPGYIAPEVLCYKGNKMYSNKCDIYSAGIIFYLAITGKNLFIGNDSKEILKNNKQANVNFEIPEFNYDPICTDLLQKMLTIDPNQRFSAKECLQHDYFQVNNTVIKEIEEKMLIFQQEKQLFMQKQNQQLVTQKQNQQQQEKSKQIQIQDKIQNYNNQKIQKINLLKISLQQKENSSEESLDININSPLLNGRVDSIESISGYLSQSPSNKLKIDLQSQGSTRVQQQQQKYNKDYNPEQETSNQITLKQDQQNVNKKIQNSQTQQKQQQQLDFESTILQMERPLIKLSKQIKQENQNLHKLAIRNNMLNNNITIQQQQEKKILFEQFDMQINYIEDHKSSSSDSLEIITPKIREIVVKSFSEYFTKENSQFKYQNDQNLQQEQNKNSIQNDQKQQQELIKSKFQNQ